MDEVATLRAWLMFGKSNRRLNQQMAKDLLDCRTHLFDLVLDRRRHRCNTSVVTKSSVYRLFSALPFKQAANLQ